MSDKYVECPLKKAGLRLLRFVELGTMVIGADDKCICTTESHCRDVDKKDGMRCTVKQLTDLSYAASCRRARQGG